MKDFVRAQNVITYAAARSMVNAALDHARANGWAVAVSVLDPSGAVVASARMDGVAPAILQFAEDKAYTATLGKSTAAFAARMASAPDLTLGLQTRSRLCAWEGGLPIRLDGALIGAIGVSGAAGPEDAACAEAALARL
ncbi:MAG: heme-binding protein [Silicimonas sp.]|nr:heme-binding protein [Silicimonas sp.]